MTRTIFAPFAEDGTVNVSPEKEPRTSVFGEAGIVTMGLPTNVTIRADDDAKPCPDTTSVTPDGPDVGCMLIFEVTAKVAVA